MVLPTSRTGQCFSFFFHILFTPCVWNMLDGWPAGQPPYFRHFSHGTCKDMFRLAQRLYQILCTDRSFLSHWVRTYCQSAGQKEHAVRCGMSKSTVRYCRSKPSGWRGCFAVLLYSQIWTYLEASGSVQLCTIGSQSRTSGWK